MTAGTRVDMSPQAIEARLRQVTALSDLAPERRLDAKLDMSPDGLMRRLREVSELLRVSRMLGASRPVR